jgi:hypothetical protein
MTPTTRTGPPPYLQLQYLPTEVIDPATGTLISLADATDEQLVAISDQWHRAMQYRRDRLLETRASIARRDARGPGAA